MATLKPTSIPPKTLSQAITSSSTTFIPNSISGWDGEDLTSGDFGTLAYGAFLNSNRTIMELFSYDPTTVASGTISFVDRGLIFTGASTVVTANKLDWAVGTTILLGTDTPQFINKLASLVNANVYTGDNDFTGGTVEVPTPTASNQAATKAYADGIALAGGPDASITTKGLTRLSVSSTATLGTVTMTIASPCVVTLTSHGLTLNDTVQFTNSGGALPTGITASTNYFVISTGLTANDFQISTTIGGSAVNTSGSQSGTHTLYRTTPRAVAETDTRLPTQGENDALVGNNTDVAVGTGNKFVTQTGLQHNAEKYAADAGANDTYVITLSPAPTSYTTGMVVYFKANTVNTGAATINVNGLGAISIVKGISTALDDGDITAGMFCTLIYNGTNFVLTKPLFSTDIQTFTANGTWTKPGGAKSVLVTVIGGGGGGGGPDHTAVVTGGSGGGGGANVSQVFLASNLASTVTVTVGTGGAGGSLGAGGVGGNSSFGSHLIAYGGGAGSRDNTGGAVSGGGGGGSASVGGAGTVGAGSTGGSPTVAGTANANGISTGGAGSAVVANGKPAEYGGGGGAGSGGDNVGFTGGDSIYGGGGGGGGGSANTSEKAGGAGGGAGFSAGSGGAGGAAATGGTAGTASSLSTRGGQGGGGGGASRTATPGGVGGAGGIPGGGGGGGGSGTTTDGAGGAGARGQVVVTTYL